MSADRWSLCPKCGKTEEFLIAERQKKLNNAYGKVSSKEYLILVEKCKVPVENDVEFTFREDYEFWLDDGILHADYRGHCTRCNFLHIMKHEEVLDL